MTIEDKDLEIPEFLRRTQNSESKASLRPAIKYEKTYPVTGLSDENLRWLYVHWISGDIREAHNKPTHINEIKDPPTNGFMHAFFLKAEGIIFCPFTFSTYKVSQQSYELVNATDKSNQFKKTWAAELLTQKWMEFKKFGRNVDYNTAERIMQMLDIETPPSPVKIVTATTSKSGAEIHSERVADFQAIVDVCLYGSDPNTTKLDNFLKAIDANTSRNLLNRLEEIARIAIDEFNLIGKDPDVTEAYRGHKPWVAKARAFYQKVLDHTSTVADNKRKLRKPRVISQSKVIERQTKAIQLMDKDPETGIGTMPAEKIPNTEMVVFYSTKNRKVFVFKAQEGKKFEIAGKTLLNHDPDLSYNQTIRKPTATLPELNGATKKGVERLLEELSTKSVKQPTSRIANDFILLKAY